MLVCPTTRVNLKVVRCAKYKIGKKSVLCEGRRDLWVVSFKRTGPERLDCVRKEKVENIDA